MLDKHKKTRFISFAHSLSVGGDAVKDGYMAYEREWIRHYDALMGFENDRISDPVVGPGIVNMFAFHIGYDGIVVGGSVCAECRLKCTARIAGSVLGDLQINGYDQHSHQ